MDWTICREGEFLRLPFTPSPETTRPQTDSSDTSADWVLFKSKQRVTATNKPSNHVRGTQLMSFYANKGHA